MNRFFSVVVLAGLLLFSALGGPAAAVDFTSADLQGAWHLHAFGAYDLKGTFYYGNITLNGDGQIVASGDASYGWSPAVFDGGGLIIFPNGSVGGKLSGLSFDWGGFWIAVQHGWMNLTKDKITFIGVDYENYQLLVTMVRVE
jgi:hypothetical protein